MLFTAYLTIHEIFFYSPLFYVDFLDKVPCSPVRYWDMTLNFRFFCLRDDRHRPPCQPNFFFFFWCCGSNPGFCACYESVLQTEMHPGIVQDQSMWHSKRLSPKHNKINLWFPAKSGTSAPNHNYLEGWGRRTENSRPCWAIETIFQ